MDKVTARWLSRKLSAKGGHDVLVAFTDDPPSEPEYEYGAFNYVRFMDRDVCLDGSFTKEQVERILAKM